MDKKVRFALDTEAAHKHTWRPVKANPERPRPVLIKFLSCNNGQQESIAINFDMTQGQLKSEILRAFNVQDKDSEVNLSLPKKLGQESKELCIYTKLVHQPRVSVIFGSSRRTEDPCERIVPLSYSATAISESTHVCKRATVKSPTPAHSDGASSGVIGQTTPPAEPSCCSRLTFLVSSFAERLGLARREAGTEHLHRS